MSFASLLDGFKGRRAVVIGDLMLDEYHFGRATRISPEAPVMVIRHETTSHLPGGAANVALNLKALGADAVLIGVVGDDSAGEDLERCLETSGLGAFELIRDPGRRTTRKMRIVADHSHQVLRMDSEDDRAIDDQVEEGLAAAVARALDGADVLVASDYLKGVLSAALVGRIADEAKTKGVPVVANPKPRSLSNYRGIDLVSLNRVEAAEALGRHRGLTNEDAPEVALALRGQCGVRGLLLTLGEGGMVAAGEHEVVHCVPAPKVEVYDTAGAGDTVIATAALGLATAGFRKDVFELAAQTAACVVRHVGVATPSPEDLAAIRSTGVA